MKLTIFGATGRTGQHLLRMAINAGHKVTVLVRDPARLQIQDDRLEVITGSLDRQDCVQQAVAGADAVLSVLGPSHNRPTFEISQGMGTIIQAMKSATVKRLVISAGAGVSDPEDRPGLFDRVIKLLVKTASKNVYEDMVNTVQLVRASGLDWTVVRVPMLTDDPETGSIRVGMVGKGTGPRLSRADMAGFILKQAESGEFSGRAPVISN